MQSQHKIIALLAATVFSFGFGCSMLDNMTLEDVASGSGIVAEVSGDMADQTTGEASSTLRLVSIITDTLSALAFAFIGWRLKTKPKKED